MIFSGIKREIWTISNSEREFLNNEDDFLALYDKKHESSANILIINYAIDYGQCSTKH